MNNGKQTIYKYTFVAICQWKIKTLQGLYYKDKDKPYKDKDLKLVLKESLRTRINITDTKCTNLTTQILFICQVDSVNNVQNCLPSIVNYTSLAGFRRLYGVDSCAIK